MAISATTEWDVRTTGSDSNGGGFDKAATGTDYSQQDSPQVTYTDLVIGATNTQLTSSAHSFTSAHVGNIINVTGGTGFTVQRVQIVSVASGVATCDKACGTASSTGGSGNLGGSLATVSAANSAAASGNTVHIKSGTYTQTASLAVPVATITWKGYASSHGDGGTKPLITTATNSVDLITTSSNGGYQIFDNLSLRSTATTPGNGIVQLSQHGTSQWWVFKNCILSGFLVGINSDNVGAHYDVSSIAVISTEIANCSTYSVHSNIGTLEIEGSYFHGSVSGGHAQLNSGGPLYASRSIFAGAAGGYAVGVNGVTPAILTQCTFANNAGNGFASGTSSTYVALTNNIFYGNNKALFIFGGFFTAALKNAFGGNTTPNTNWPTNSTDISLTADPFTDSAAGDYSLNSTAGGGTACKGAGYPSVFPGGTTTGHADIGAVQSSGGGGSTPGNYAFMG